MNLFFQISKTGRVFLQAVQPFLRMTLQTLVDFRQHRIDAFQGGLLLALQANFHELCLLRGIMIASSCSWNPMKYLHGHHHFSGTDPTGATTTAPNGPYYI